MKIEIAESLTRSWLRHVEKCEFAELNWKPSPTWKIKQRPIIESYFNKAKAFWPEAFGKNSLDQLLKQSEVDVAGFSFNNEMPVTHFVDVAFHAGGLNYGGSQETAKRVFKKLIRSGLLALAYFPNSKAKLYFVSPFTSNTTSKAVESALLNVNDVFSDLELVSAECILNEQFKLNILNEVMMLTGNVADTSELFLRSWQLIEPFTECHIQSADTTLYQSEELVVANDIDREKMLATALYLARFEHHFLNIGNQTETFRHFASQLRIPYGTLRNYRDRFDRYVDNHRQGWNAPLTNELQSIIDRYGDNDEVSLREYIKT
ncbi:hypothetical protein ACLKMH_17475 [Psychromonas sp. KJ10-10]|uniref:hypothetical protein n=1 Tax=Psychromonas sp. KJ10-10 TaxID=3391823 RepID=UPI0039B4F311